MRGRRRRRGPGLCDEFHLAPFADTPPYLEFLIARLKEADVSCPSSTRSFWPSRRAGTGCRRNFGAVAVSAPEVLRDVSKMPFQRACLDADLPIVREAAPAPAIFEPRIGRGGKGVIEARDSRLFEALRGPDGVMQQAIDGVESTVDAMYDRDGKMLATVARQHCARPGPNDGEVDSTELASAGEPLEGAGASLCHQVPVDSRWQGRDSIINDPRLRKRLFSTLAGCDPFAATLAASRGDAWPVTPGAFTSGVTGRK